MSIESNIEQPTQKTSGDAGRRPPNWGLRVAPASLPDRPTLLKVVLIVVCGLILRLWGIGWSLPNVHHPYATYHPDELVNLTAALGADIPHLKFDIGFYNYGAFYFYLVSFAQTLGRGYGLIPHTPQNYGLLDIAHEQSALFLAGRLVTALMGTATIALMYALGNRLYGRRAGLVAALLYALAPLAVVHAHFLTVDVPATFFVTLALLWSARLLVEQNWLTYAWAGIWCGLAAATKYNAGLVLIAPIVAHIVNLPPNSCRKHRGAQFVVLLCVAAIAFLLGCPGPILNLDAFWNGKPNYPGSGVRYELFVHSRTGHGYLFTNTGPGWWYHLIVSLPYGLGLPLLLLSLAGLVYALRKRTRADLVLLSFLALYYVTTSLSAVRFARYMIPLFPALCLLAGRLVTEVSPKQTTTRIKQVVGVAVGLLTALYTVTLVLQMSAQDPRDRVADYLNRHESQGASIAFATIPWFYSPPLSPLFGALAAPQRQKAAQETTRYRLRISSTEWDRGVLSPPPDALVISNIETMHELDRLRLSAPVQFMRSLSPGYQQIRFGPGPILGLPPNRTIIPEDLLYIMPTLTIYQQPGSVAPDAGRAVAPSP